MWSGWRQGNSEEWLISSWLPFWRGLSKEDRETYLRQWPAPGDWPAQLARWAG